MNITQEKSGDLTSLVKLQIQKADYEPKVTAGIKKLAKQVAIKGFRPGMVPMPVVKKMHGNAVLMEELNKLLNDSISNYLQENKVEVLGQPIPAEGQGMLDVDINNMQDLEFTYEIGHAPAFELSYLDKSPTFPKYKVQVEDKMIDEEVARVRKRFSTYEYPENVQAEDILSVTIEELNEDGSVKDGGISTVSSITLDLLKEAEKATFLNLKKHESLEKNVWEIFDREKEAIAKNVLNVTDLSTVETIGNKFKLTLNNITRAIAAELNEEFFTKAYGEGGINNETDMRATIKGDLEAYFDGQSDSYMVNDLYKGIMENVEFPLPDTFLKRWVRVANEKPVSAEQVEEDYPRFSKQLRWSLITQKVIRENNLQVTPEEIKDKVRVNLLQQLFGYGMKNMQEEWIEQFVEKQMKDRKNLEQTHDQILDEKVIGFMKSKVKMNEKSISFEDFKTMVEAGSNI